MNAVCLRPLKAKKILIGKEITMAKIKKMADGGIAGLGSLLAGVNGNIPAYKDLPSQPSPRLGGLLGGGGTGGGGGSAQDGLGQINQGAGTVASAISRASDALGGGGGVGGVQPQGEKIDMTGVTYKKGGSVKKYSSGGKINLKDCSVSTAPKGKKNSNW